MSQKTVTVSVRRLVEFILRSGDIDTVSGTFGEMDAMQQGGLMHRKLQKEAGPSYRAEVSLKHTTEMDETLAITVEGRADGVITETEMAADESGELGLKVLKTFLPDSKRFRRELTGEHRALFRSTLFPADGTLVKGSNLKEITEELLSIIRK